MTITEINKLLKKEDISPELRKQLEKRKQILLNDKEVKKC